MQLLSLKPGFEMQVTSLRARLSYLAAALELMRKQRCTVRTSLCNSVMYLGVAVCAVTPWPFSAKSNVVKDHRHS